MLSVVTVLNCNAFCHKVSFKNTLKEIFGKCFPWPWDLPCSFLESRKPGTKEERYNSKGGVRFYLISSKVGTLAGFVLFKVEMVLQARKVKKAIKVTGGNQVRRDLLGIQSWAIRNLQLEQLKKRPLEALCSFAGGAEFALLTEELFSCMKASKYEGLWQQIYLN